MQQPQRDVVPQLPSEIWSNIANQLSPQERLSRFDPLCREFHSLPWESIDLRIMCKGYDHSLANVQPPLSWVMSVWARVQKLRVSFYDNFQEILKLDDKLEDTKEMVDTLRALGSNLAGKDSPTSLDLSTLWDCPLPSGFLQSWLSLMPNLTMLCVYGEVMNRLPPLMYLQDLSIQLQKSSRILLEDLQQLPCLKHLTLSRRRPLFDGADATIVGAIQLEHAYHLQCLRLIQIVPESLRLHPSCEVHIVLRTCALTPRLEKCLESVNVTNLRLSDREAVSVQDVLHRRLGSVGSLREVSVSFWQGDPVPSRSGSITSSASRPILRLNGPLLQHCTSLSIDIFSNVGIWIPAHMHLSNLKLYSYYSHPKMIDAEDLDALGKSLRRVDIELDTQGLCGNKKGTKPACCMRLLAAAVHAEKTFRS